jgi:hypothetical protein
MQRKLKRSREAVVWLCWSRFAGVLPVPQLHCSVPSKVTGLSAQSRRSLAVPHSLHSLPHSLWPCLSPHRTLRHAPRDPYPFILCHTLTRCRPTRTLRSRSSIDDDTLLPLAPPPMRGTSETLCCTVNSRGNIEPGSSPPPVHTRSTNAHLSTPHRTHERVEKPNFPLNVKRVVKPVPVLPP